jgi:hypothetical protein
MSDEYAHRTAEDISQDIRARQFLEMLGRITELTKQLAAKDAEIAMIHQAMRESVFRTSSDDMQDGDLMYLDDFTEELTRLRKEKPHDH